MTNKRPTFNDFKKEAFKSDQFKSEYDKLKLEFELADKLLIARKRARLSQKELAERLHTKQPAIARFENGGCAKSSIERLEAYVDALGFELDIKLVPKNQPDNSSHYAHF